MGFFKKVKQKINGMWYPQSITVGKPVTTDEVAKRLAIESTVSPADTFAVLKSLGSVLGSYMADGRHRQTRRRGHILLHSRCFGQWSGLPRQK